MVVLGPKDMEHPTAEDEVVFAPGALGQRRSDAGRARTRAARKGFARAAFPDAHFDMPPVDDFHEFRVGPAGKKGMMLKKRPKLGQIQPINTLGEDNGVGIAHRNRRYLPYAASHLQGAVDERLAFAAHGDVAGGETGLAHIHGNGFHLAAFRMETEKADARQRLDAYAFLAGQAVVVDVLAHAADAVAAHFRFAAVAVEHAHPDVRDGRGQNEDETIRSDAAMAVADRDCQPLQGGVPGGQGVQEGDPGIPGIPGGGCDRTFLAGIHDIHIRL